MPRHRPIPRYVEPLHSPPAVVAGPFRLRHHFRDAIEDESTPSDYSFGRSLRRDLAAVLDAYDILHVRTLRTPSLITAERVQTRLDLLPPNPARPPFVRTTTHPSPWFWSFLVYVHPGQARLWRALAAAVSHHGIIDDIELDDLLFYHEQQSRRDYLCMMERMMTDILDTVDCDEDDGDDDDDDDVIEDSADDSEDEYEYEDEFGEHARFSNHSDFPERASGDGMDAYRDVSYSRLRETERENEALVNFTSSYSDELDSYSITSGASSVSERDVPDRWRRTRRRRTLGSGRPAQTMQQRRAPMPTVAQWEEHQQRRRELRDQQRHWEQRPQFRYSHRFGEDQRRLEEEPVYHQHPHWHHHHSHYHNRNQPHEDHYRLAIGESHVPPFATRAWSPLDDLSTRTSQGGMTTDRGRDGDETRVESESESGTAMFYYLPREASTNTSIRSIPSSGDREDVETGPAFLEPPARLDHLNRP